MDLVPASSAPESADCLSDDDAAGLVADELPAAQRRAFADHMDVCDRCRRLVSAIAAVGAATHREQGAPDSDAGLRAGQVLGRFALTRLLGRGSMGEVWAARDQELDREVALKLLRLHPGALGTEATARLRREAQAMARLNHANVVAIHELGSDDLGRVFCAMELVDGVTLRRWLETPRSWREVLGVASAVARGVAAAHAVRLIHRDIKPENILIAADGRTLVSDFGLAKLVDLGADTGDSGDGGDDSLASSPIGTLTATGAMIGTPVYMAPEQLARKHADARSDQFSYCATVYEALFGTRPFAGDTVEELAKRIAQGPPRPAHQGGVPAGVARCLARGLAADPAARWPSMTALLDELERAARRPRPRRIAALVAGGALVAAAAALVISRRPDPFELAARTAEQRIAAVWSPVKAAGLEARFVATGAPLARERAATTTRLLDGYRAAWTAQRLDAWSAAHVRGQQTPEVLERRLACFDQLADALDGLVSLFLAPSVRDVEQAPQIVHRLDPVASCGDVDRLLARPIAPAAPQGRRIERELRELQVAMIAGRHAEVVQRATALIEDATRLGEPGLRARARHLLGSALASGGHLVEAEAALRLAVQEAAAARDHFLVADCWLRLLTLIGLELGHLGDTAATEPAVRAAVAQAGNDPRQLADLAETLGLAAIARGDLATAHDRLLEARDRRAATRGADDPSVANDEANLGAILMQLGRSDEAVQHLERAIAIVRASFGEHHPVLAQAEHNLATLAGDRHDWVAAERHARAAVAMNVAVRGADHPDIARVRINLARILREQRRFDDARAELALARATLARSLPPSHPSVIVFDIYPAQVAEAEGRWDEAVRLTRPVVEATRRAGNPALQRFALSELARMVGHTAPRDAMPLYDEMLRLNLGQNGRSVRDDVEVLTEFIDVALRAGQPAAALAWLDRMPEAASQLAEPRRRLQDALARRP